MSELTNINKHSEIAERLNVLVNTYGEGSKAEFARLIDVKAQSLTNWAKRGMSKDAIAKIKKSIPELNIDWLLTGEGEMLKNVESNAQLVGGAAKAIAEDTVPVRFFEVTPTATFQEFCAGASEAAVSTNIVPAIGEALDNSYCVFEINGESMAPQIQPHARVLCREIPPTRWHCLDGCIVVIAYRDRFVIKRIVANDIQLRDSITLASDNSAYPQRETVQLADIRAIFKAKRIISSPII